MDELKKERPHILPVKPWTYGELPKSRVDQAINRLVEIVVESELVDVSVSQKTDDEGREYARRVLRVPEDPNSSYQ
ncbi:MAG: hypothetical protein WAV41_00165 [Microgenomates group bacterium]